LGKSAGKKRRKRHICLIGTLWRPSSDERPGEKKRGKKITNVGGRSPQGREGALALRQGDEGLGEQPKS